MFVSSLHDVRFHCIIAARAKAELRSTRRLERVARTAELRRKNERYQRSRRVSLSGLTADLQREGDNLASSQCIQSYRVTVSRLDAILHASSWCKCDAHSAVSQLIYKEKVSTTVCTQSTMLTHMHPYMQYDAHLFGQARSGSWTVYACSMFDSAPRISGKTQTVSYPGSQLEPIKSGQNT